MLDHPAPQWRITISGRKIRATNSQSASVSNMASRQRASERADGMYVMAPALIDGLFCRKARGLSLVISMRRAGVASSLDRAGAGAGPRLRDESACWRDKIDRSGKKARRFRRRRGGAIRVPDRAFTGHARHEFTIPAERDEDIITRAEDVGRTATDAWMNSLFRAGLAWRVHLRTRRGESFETIGTGRASYPF